MEGSAIRQPHRKPHPFWTLTSLLALLWSGMPLATATATVAPAPTAKVSPQPGPEPTPKLKLQEVLDRHAAAMGYSRHSSPARALHIRAQVTGLGLKGTVESWYEAPLYGWSRLALGPLSIESGYDGIRGWIMDRNGVVRSAEGSEETGTVLESIVNLGAYVLEHPPVPMQLALEAADESGRPRLSLKLLGAKPETLTLDPVSYRLAESSWDNGQMQLKTIYEHYREVEGFWIPDRIRMETGNQMSLTATLQLAEFAPPRGKEAYVTPASRRDGPLFHGGSESGHLAMVGPGSHILIRGTLNRSHEGLFLLDTGAGSSILDSGQLKALGLSSQGELEATGAAGSAPAALVQIESLALGRMEFPAQSWVSLELSSVTSLLTQEKVTGVLGYDTLNQSVIEIDYGNRWVQFHSRRGFTPPRDAKEIPLRMDANVPTVRVSIEGIEAWVHLDTGSDNELDLSAPFVQKHKLLESKDRGEMSPAGVRGIGGSSRAMRGFLRRLELGGFVFEDLPANFSTSNEGVMGSTDVAGVLGAGILSRFHLYLDYASSRLWIESTGSEQVGPNPAGE